MEKNNISFSQVYNRNNFSYNGEDYVREENIISDNGKVTSHTIKWFNAKENTEHVYGKLTYEYVFTNAYKTTNGWLHLPCLGKEINETNPIPEIEVEFLKTIIEKL